MKAAIAFVCGVVVTMVTFLAGVGFALETINNENLINNNISNKEL